MRLRIKLFLPVLLLWCGLFLAFHYYWLPSFIQRDVEHHKQQQAEKIDILANSLTEAVLKGDMAGIRATLDNILARHSDWVRIILQDKDNKVIYPAELKPTLLTPTQYSTSYSHHHNGSRFLTINLIADTRALLADQKAMTQEFDILFMVIFLLAVTGSFILEDRLVQRPVVKLVDAAARIGRHDFSVSLATARNDELGELLNAFDKMSQDVQNYEQQLQMACEEALQATRAKTEFLAKMSHELRTPLNAIMGYCELLQEELSDVAIAAGHEDLDKIYYASKHLLSLIDDVLDITKIESGKMNIHIGQFYLGKTLMELTHMLKPLQEQNHNTIHIHPCPSIELINSDAMKVKQILYNLLSNALKFTHNGEIHITVSETSINQRAFFRVDVSDTGIGIAADKLPMLFQPFNQADDSYSRPYDGTGLGLALSKKLCHMLDGDIEVHSIPGQGSTFSIWLPVQSSQRLTS